MDTPLAYTGLAPEQALVEREQANLALEQRVAERTHALEQALADLRTRETWLHTILQTTLDGFWVVDAQQHFVDVNAAYCAMSGYSRDEILALRITDVEAIEQSEETDRRIQRIIATGRDRFESCHRRKDGSQFDVEVSVTYVASTGLMVCFCRDITERRRATEELLHAKKVAEVADRIKSTFLAHVSHEIRTPLTAVIGMTSLLCDTNLLPLQRDYATTIQTSAETLLTIINNILDLSKIETGQIELNLQPLDLRICLKEALDLVAQQAARKGLLLEVLIDPAVPHLLIGDMTRLRQVLANLLSNAVKFTERGAVTMSVNSWPLTETGYELVLSIRDTGIGIAPDRQQQIFDPFVQADSLTLPRVGGTGMGLAISKQLIERMGGRISVTSTPDVGSTFTLNLPIISAADPGSLPDRYPDEDVPAADPLRVLLAEDSPINQQLIRRLLQSLGHRPDVVANGAEALAAVRQQVYDVILMDIQMPELDGESATRHIRALTGIAQPTIIALTASAMRGDRERYLAIGMDDYLSKPLQRDELRAILNRVRTQRDLASAASTTQLALQLGAERMPDGRLVDWTILDRLIESIGGAQTGGIVLDLFRGNLSAQMQEIIAAVAADDRPRVRLLAHKLRGGSQQLGATGLAEQYAALELAAQGEEQALENLLERARHTFDETLALFSARLAPPDAGRT